RGRDGKRIPSETIRAQLRSAGGVTARSEGGASAMFWHEARDRYKRVTADDEDVKKFLELSHRFQEDLYEGITGAVCDLGHRWVAARTPAGKILEIGFGSGRHSLFFSRQREDYFPSEMSPVHATSPLWSGVLGRVLRCDARTLPFGDG